MTSEKVYMPGGYRRYCFTINNPTDVAGEPGNFVTPESVLHCNGHLPAGISYVVYQKEQGEQQTPHYQGYIVFANPVSMGVVKNTLGSPAAHVERAKGNDDQNKEYCTKPDGRLEGPWEFGQCPHQGQRTDLQGLCKMVTEGKPDHEIAQTHPVEYAKYAKNIRNLREGLLAPARRDAVQVHTLVGPTDCGKTYWCFEHYPDLYRVNLPEMHGQKLWWDGYTGQKTILLDDFYGEIPLPQMLHILDPYPLRIEIKGGTTAAAWTTVLITSNDPPQNWYSAHNHSPASIGALMRRLTKPPSVVSMLGSLADTQMMLPMPIAAPVAAIHAAPAPSHAPPAASADADADAMQDMLNSCTPELYPDDELAAIPDPPLKRHNAMASPIISM